jgi:hypothetical protein
MAGISNADLVDLTKTTLENLPSMDFEVALSQVNYPAVNEWFQEDRLEEDGGTSIVRNIMLDNSGNARHVRLYQRSSINVADVQKRTSAPWVQIEGQWSIERREVLRNRGKAKLISLIESRRLDAMLAMADLLEQRAWKAPNDSSDDLNPRGIVYYLSKLVPAVGSGYSSAIDIAGGFAGRRVIFNDTTSTLTDKGGLSPTTYSKWRNYVDEKTGINADFVKKMSKAFYATKFRSPVTAKDLKKGPASKFRIYMGLDNVVEYGELARKANENLGADLDKFHGVLAFNRIPVEHAPNLDADTDAAVYGINFSKFKPVVLEGDWMREDEPDRDPELHNVVTTFVDGSYQYLCTNVREAGFVIHNRMTA